MIGLKYPILVGKENNGITLSHLGPIGKDIFKMFEQIYDPESIVKSC